MKGRGEYKYFYKILTVLFFLISFLFSCTIFTTRETITITVINTTYHPVRIETGLGSQKVAAKTKEKVSVEKGVYIKAVDDVTGESFLQQIFYFNDQKWYIR